MRSIHSRSRIGHGDLIQSDTVHTDFDPTPFAPGEWEVLSALLAGHCYEAELLRAQVDSIRFASSWYDAPVQGWFFKKPPFVYMERHAARATFSVRTPEDYACDDWQLGDRRRIEIADVTCSLHGGAGVRCTLAIEGGFVRHLSIGEILPGSWVGEREGGTEHLDPTTVGYCDTSAQGIGSDGGRPGGGICAILRIPAAIKNCTEWQQWIIDLDKVRRPHEGFAFPFTVRRARPATLDDIYELEQRHGILVPRDLMEFWLTTNGMAFLGATIAGTYDVTFLADPDNALLLSTDAFGEGTYLTVATGKQNTDRPESGAVLLYSPEGNRTWRSVKDCFVEYANG